ncbi:MAG: hypothetical protein MJ105_02315 [Lachnospiraceae bacterium]|nr:hypothetical protein [Lachnospiraceae bacterium]
MSKNLEEAYINSIESSAPDLWGRISARIDAYEAEQAMHVQEEAVTKMPENVIPMTAGKKKPQTKTFMKRYGGVVVAAAALVIAVPTILLVSRNGGRKSMETATTDMMAESTTSTYESIAGGAYWDSKDVAESAMDDMMEADYDAGDAVCTETNAVSEEASITEGAVMESEKEDCEESDCAPSEMFWYDVQAQVLAVDGDELTLQISELDGEEDELVYPGAILEGVVCPPDYVDSMGIGDEVAVTLLYDGVLWNLVSRTDCY